MGANLSDKEVIIGIQLEGHQRHDYYSLLKTVSLYNAIPEI